ncbi:hypothetical protein [Granulicoccus phenolivorans]|uniref:hypothetical protein n=1 Tax=Granulicoccus phenolivorans TaxID=266854 RepID=UPI0007679AE1|nr:hypothetical protein [Granulicoccus phenolivorans]
MILEPAEVPAGIAATIGDSILLDLMIAALNSQVSRVAPCLTDAPDTGKLAEAKLIMLATLERWGKAGSGGLQTQQMTAGPFANTTTVDTRTRAGWKLWPSDIKALQELCKEPTGREGKAFTVDLGPGWGYSD